MRIRLLVVAVFMALSAETHARTYTNATFGLQVELPTGKTVCTAADGESDRGFTILWEQNDCPPTDDANGIYVYVQYNALGWHSTLEEGKSDCVTSSVRASPFAVSGARFYQCKLLTDLWHVSLSFFVLRNKDINPPDNEVSYGVTLICPHGDCRRLMPLVHWIFAHMKFIKQE